MKECIKKIYKRIISSKYTGIRNFTKDIYIIDTKRGLGEREIGIKIIDIGQDKYIVFDIKDNKIINEREYVAGKFDGQYKKINKNGSVIIEGEYNQDIKIGEWKYYNEVGGLIKTELWDNGVRIDVKYNKKGSSR